jgi:hypothetical protein
MVMAVKVSQATIDRIKQMGMTKALGGVKSTSGAEYKEALRRMYGQKRLDAALGKGGATYKSADAARAASMPKTTTPKYKSADAARAAATSSIATKPKTKTTTKSSLPKTTDKVFGVSVADWRKAYGAPVNPPKPKVKTAAQKAAEAKATAARRKAAAAAVKAANGRTH